MAKTPFFSSPHKVRRNRLLGLMCVLAALAYACAGGVSTSATATPASANGSASSVIPPTEPVAGTTAPGKINPGKAPDACALATQPEVEAVLGQAPTTIVPGKDPNNVFGGITYSCTYPGTDLAVVITLMEFDSPATAKNAMNKQLAIVQGVGTSPPVPESGLGDQAFWSTVPAGCSFTVLKGSRISSILLGGNIGDPASHKAALKILAKSVIAKL
jgi:hypothetical protein